jgi:hypothetical protein
VTSVYKEPSVTILFFGNDERSIGGSSLRIPIFTIDLNESGVDATGEFDFSSFFVFWYF